MEGLHEIKAVSIAEGNREYAEHERRTAKTILGDCIHNHLIDMVIASAKLLTETEARVKELDASLDRAQGKSYIRVLHALDRERSLERAARKQFQGYMDAVSTGR